MEFQSKKFRNDLNAQESQSEVDKELYDLRTRTATENVRESLIHCMDVCFKYKEHREFFKLKEFFVQTMEMHSQIPEMQEKDNVRFLELFMLITAKHPSPLAQRGFLLLHNFLVNPHQLKNNKVMSDCFVLNYDNVNRIGIPYYLENKECVAIAIEYCVYFLRTFPEANILHFTQNPEIQQKISWTDRRMMSKEIEDFNIQRREIKELVDRTISSYNASFGQLLSDFAKVKAIDQVVIESKKKLAELEKLPIMMEEVSKAKILIETHAGSLQKVMERQNTADARCNTIEEKIRLTLNEGAIFKRLNDLEELTGTMNKTMTSMGLFNINLLDYTKLNVFEEFRSDMVSELGKVDHKLMNLEANLGQVRETVDKNLSRVETFALSQNNLEQHIAETQKEISVSRQTISIFTEKVNTLMEYSKNLNIEKREEFYKKILDIYDHHNEFVEKIHKLEEVFKESEAKDSFERWLEVTKDMKGRLQEELTITKDIQANNQAELAKMKEILSLLVPKTKSSEQSIDSLTSEVLLNVKTLRELSAKCFELEENIKVNKLDNEACSINITHVSKNLHEHVESFNVAQQETHRSISNMMDKLLEQEKSSSDHLRELLDEQYNKMWRGISEFEEKSTKTVDPRAQYLPNRLTKLETLVEKINSIMESTDTKLLKTDEKLREMKRQVEEYHNYFAVFLKETGVEISSDGQLHFLHTDLTKVENESGVPSMKELSIAEPKENENNDKITFYQRMKHDLGILGREFKIFFKVMPFLYKRFFELEQDFYSKLPQLQLGEDVPMRKKEEHFQLKTFEDVYHLYQRIEAKLMGELKTVKDDIAKRNTICDEGASGFRSNIADINKDLDTLQTLFPAKDQLNDRIVDLQALVQNRNRELKSELEKLNSHIVKNQRECDERFKTQGTELNFVSYILRGEKDNMVPPPTLPLSNQMTQIRFPSQLEINQVPSNSNIPEVLKMEKTQSREFREYSRAGSPIGEILQPPESRRELVERVERLETLTSDYTKFFIEPEAYSRLMKLHKPYVSLKEKLDSILFLIRNSFVIKSKFIELGLQYLKETMQVQNSSAQAKPFKAKETILEEIARLIRLTVDSSKPDFLYFLLEMLYVLLNDDVIISFAYEIGLFKLLLFLVRRQNLKEKVQIVILKLIGALTKYEEFLELIIQNNLMINIIDILIKFADKFNVPLNADFELEPVPINSNNRLISPPNLIDEMDGMLETMKETPTIIDKIKNNFQVTGAYFTAHSLELCHQVVIILYHCGKKDSLLLHFPQNKIVPLLYEIYKARRVTRLIKILILKYFRLICRIEANINIFKNEETMKFIIGVFTDKSSDNDIKRILVELVNTLCEKDKDIRKFFETPESRGHAPYRSAISTKHTPRRKQTYDEIAGLDEIKTLNESKQQHHHNQSHQISKLQSPETAFEAPSPNVLRQIQRFRTGKYGNKSSMRATSLNPIVPQTDRAVTPTLAFNDNLPRIQRKPSRQPRKTNTFKGEFETLDNLHTPDNLNLSSL